MTRVLLVEDDASQARLLARAISLRRPEYTVITAENGEDATKLLSREEVDLVLTDLQMPIMNGFELLAWILKHRPHLPVLTMTAYGTKEALAQLRAYGSSECFVKPVDIATVIEHMAESLSQGVRGHVQNLGLASFLQLIEMEKKTCTLHVEHEGKSGTLFVRKGTLIDAEFGERGGEDAATAILAWTGAGIRISGSCSRQVRVIDKPFSYLVMEAMRLQDEARRQATDGAVPEQDEDCDVELSESGFFGSPTPFPVEPLALEPLAEVEPLALEPLVLEPFPEVVTTPVPLASVAPRSIRVPACALAIAVVDSMTGVLLARGHADASVPLPELAAMAGEILRHEGILVEEDESESVLELVLTSKLRCELIRPVAELPGVFALMVFNPADANLALARHELETVLSSLEWLHPAPSW